MTLKELYYVYDGSMSVNMINDDGTMLGRLTRISTFTLDYFETIANARVLLVEYDCDGVNVKVEITSKHHTI